jgi:hypothetical protein
MSKPPVDFERELKAVTGERYEEGAHQGLLRRLGHRAVKWAIGVALAVATAALIVFILHFHLKQAQTAPRPSRPVPVQIIPGR